MVRKDPLPFETLTIPVARADFVLGAPAARHFRLVIEELKEAKSDNELHPMGGCRTSARGGKSGNERALIPISPTHAANDAIYQSTATG
jgi:hypothetical protein